MDAEIDLDVILERLLSVRSPQGQLQFVDLTPGECLYVAEKSRVIFESEAIMPEIEPPLTICGDIHGQYRDLLRIMRPDRMPPCRNYLFLGDYVDRGQQCLEVVMLLFILKIKYPSNMLLLRGNHEAEQLNLIYGFYTECKARVTEEVFKSFNNAFAFMPLAAIVAKKIFCCHGGIPRNLESLDEIRNLERPISKTLNEGLVCDLLWADPSLEEYACENERGASWCFGENDLNAFLDKFGFDVLVRGHEVVRSGYEFFANRRGVTLFSAANYCNEFPNAVGVMHVDRELLCSFSVLKPHKAPRGNVRAWIRRRIPL